MPGDNVLAYAQLPSGPPGQMQLDSANNLKVTVGGSGGGSVSQGPGASAGTAWRIEGDFTEFSGSASAVNADLVASFDCSIFKAGSLALSGSWNGTINVQASNDNSQFFNVVTNGVSLSGNQQTGITFNSMFVFPVTFRYLRIRMTSYSSGTASAVLEMYTNPFSAQLFGTAILGQGTNSIGTIQPGNTPNTTPWLANPSGCTYSLVTQSSSDTTVKGSAGVYYGAKVSATGANAPNINDGSNLIDIIAASSAVGTESLVPEGGVKFATSLVVKGSSTNPNLIVYYL